MGVCQEVSGEPYVWLGFLMSEMWLSGVYCGAVGVEFLSAGQNNIGVSCLCVLVGATLSEY